MNEARRQSCLAHMGVTLWYARARLPGAAASPDFAFSAQVDSVRPLSSVPLQPPSPAAEKPDRAPPAPQGQAQSLRRIQSVRASLAESGTVAPTRAPTGPDTLVAAEPPVVTARAPASHEYRIHSALWSGQWLNMVVDLSSDVSEDVQLALAANIGRALGDEPEQLHSLTWPVFANAAVPGNDDDGLLRVGLRLLDNMPDRSWLAIGEQSSAFLELLRGSCDRDKIPGIWLYTRDNLQSLAADASKKRALWAELQQRLSDSPLARG